MDSTRPKNRPQEPRVASLTSSPCNAASRRQTAPDGPLKRRPASTGYRNYSEGGHHAQIYVWLSAARPAVAQVRRASMPALRIAGGLLAAHNLSRRRTSAEGLDLCGLGVTDLRLRLIRGLDSLPLASVKDPGVGAGVIARGLSTARCRPPALFAAFFGLHG